MAELPERDFDGSANGVLRGDLASAGSAYRRTRTDLQIRASEIQGLLRRARSRGLSLDEAVQLTGLNAEELAKLGGTGEGRECELDDLRGQVDAAEDEAARIAGEAVEEHRKVCALTAALQKELEWLKTPDNGVAPAAAAQRADALFAVLCTGEGQ